MIPRLLSKQSHSLRLIICAFPLAQLIKGIHVTIMNFNHEPAFVIAIRMRFRIGGDTCFQ